MTTQTLKVFIAEDEAKVAKLIIKLIDWDALGLELVGTSLDGMDALRQIRELSPDLIITDIRMPGIDGLELIRRLREMGSEARVVIVSGHRDFEYAQQALRYKVDDYLLKPIQKEALASSLGRLGEMRTTENRALSVKQFGSLLAKLPPETSDAEVEKLCLAHQVSVNQGWYRTGYVRLGLGQRDWDELSLSHELNQRKAELEKHYGGSGLTAIHDEGVVVFLAGPVGSPPRELEGHRSGWGPEGSHPGVWLRTVRTAVRASRGLNPDDGATGGTSSSLPLSNERDLFGLFEAQNAEGFQHWLQEQGRQFAQDRPEWVLYEAACRVLELFLQASTLQVPQPQEAPKMRLRLVSSLDRNEGPLGFISALESTVGKALGDLADATRNRESPAVRQVREHLTSHYREPIQLENLAELTKMNPNYLATLFKKETGLTIIEFLTNHRMELAKSRLREGNDKLTTIGIEVGYADLRYFLKVFRKQVGVTPAEYRKIHR